MLLAVDIGNSTIAFGFWREERDWVQLRHPTTEYASAAFALERWIEKEKIHPAEVRRTVLSSVVPDITASLLQVLTNQFQPEPLLLDKSLYPKWTIQIDHPEEIGADLVANATSAYARVAKPCIIVDFGTALSFTAVGAKGEILGVAIAPGLTTAMKSLFVNTAQLPMIPLEMPHSVIGKNTVQSLQAGILRGYVGLVREILSQMTQEMGGEAIYFATGGLAHILAPLQDKFYQIDKTLTLDGLRLISEEFG